MRLKNLFLNRNSSIRFNSSGSIKKCKNVLSDWGILLSIKCLSGIDNNINLPYITYSTTKEDQWNIRR